MSWTITPQTKVPVDPYRSQVSLLLHGDGANGSTTITDSSPTPKTVTAFGNAQISTAQSKFGGSSIAFDGSGDYLSVPAYDFLGDFTVEAWVRPANTAGFQTYIGNWKNEQFALSQSGSLLALSWFPQSASGPFVSGAGIVAGQWQHVAAARSGSSFYIFINGQIAGTGTSATTAVGSTTPLLIGAYPDGNGSPAGLFNGYMDDVRISRLARYTSNFTPPTAPFPDI